MFNFPDSQFFFDKFGIHVDLFRYILIGGLIFTRFFMITLVTPFLGAKPVPGRLRISLCVAFLVFFYPIVSSISPAQMPTDTVTIVGLFLKEVLFGFLLGFAVSAVFFGVQAAGNMVDNQRQLANARIFNPALGSQASLFGVFYYQFALVIFLVLGGHRMFIEAVGKSFQTVPVLAFPTLATSFEPIMDLIIHLAADTLIISLQLSAPVLVAIFIADIILGLTNRVAPMINVFEMGFNIKGYVGVVLAYLSLPLVYVQMKLWFKYTIDAVNVVVNFFIR